MTSLWILALVAQAIVSKDGLVYLVGLNVAHEAAQLYHLTLPDANRCIASFNRK
jgi:hypothetical protein